MKTLTCIVLALFILACTNERQKEQTPRSSTDTSKVIYEDAIFLKSDTLKKKESKITNEFKVLIEYLDSVGYVCDTIKAQKSYRYLDSLIIIRAYGYSFYKINLRNTVPFYHLKRVAKHIEYYEKQVLDSSQLARHEAWKTKMFIDLKFLEGVEDIYSYHYVAKKSATSGSSKTFKDGIIEQWRFTSKEAAKRAAEEIGAKETWIYINRGAYVCYLENFVFIFHSRSAGFYTPLKQFFKRFIKNNTAIQTST